MMPVRSVCLWRLWVTGCNGSRISLHACIWMSLLLTTPDPDSRLDDAGISGGRAGYWKIGSDIAYLARSANLPTGLYILLALISFFFLNWAKLSQDLLDRFSRSFYQMEGICVNVVYPVHFFPIPEGTFPWQPILCRSRLVRSEPKYLSIRWTDFHNLCTIW